MGRVYTPLLVAWRYLRGRRKARMAQWVTRASALGLAVGTAAMVVGRILVCNGIPVILDQRR